MPGMTFEQYAEKLTLEFQRVQTYNNELRKKTRPAELSALCDKVDRLVEDHKLDFDPNTKRPRLLYAGGFDLRTQECKLLRELIFCASVLKYDNCLVDGLNLITRSAPKVGYFFSGVQDTFQQALEEIIRVHDKTTPINLEPKLPMDVRDIADMRQRDEAANVLAASLITAPVTLNGSDDEKQHQQRQWPLF